MNPEDKNKPDELFQPSYKPEAQPVSPEVPAQPQTNNQPSSSTQQQPTQPVAAAPLTPQTPTQIPTDPKDQHPPNTNTFAAASSSVKDEAQKTKKIMVVLGGIIMFFLVLVVIIVVASSGGNENAQLPDQTPKGESYVQEPSSIDVQDVSNSIADDIAGLNTEADFPVEKLEDNSIGL